MGLNIAALEKHLSEMKTLLKDGLLACDIWDRSKGLSLVSYNSKPEGVALFNVLTQDIDITLKNSGFPTLGKYYMLDLEGDLFVIVQHGKQYLQGMLLDDEKVNIGLLLSVAIPKALEAVAKAQA